jgi:glycogen phosphorylase
MSPRPIRIPTPAAGRLDEDHIVESFAHHMMYTVAKDEHTATGFDVYKALAHAVRDRLMERWFRTQSAYYHADAKRVYYLSLEFLLGRALVHNVVNLGARDAYIGALRRLGCDLETLQELEWDAGLGNGGLGRLAACIMDSAATLGLPFYGYGIRYEYGIFQQRIADGAQVESPDNWLRYGNPWEIPRPDAIFPVRFYGRGEHYLDDGVLRARWVDTQDVWAMAYDTPIAGFGNDTVNTLRLWAAKSSREFDLQSFNAGEYVRAVEDKTQSENIGKVLYPPDDNYAGKELRLKQQYFFVSATLQDILRRFLKFGARRFHELPDKVQVQLNDTHPALAIPELMRILVDEHRLGWEEAWDLAQRVFGYTNHTVLPEALERWPADLLQRLLPRHFQIVEEIDRRLRLTVRGLPGTDEALVRRTAILDENAQVRMAHLAFAGSHSVNGVAALHTRILRESTFADLDRVLPGRINNKTNGITPRRWLLQCNPALAALVTGAVGQGWTTDLTRLEGLRPFAQDAAFRQEWAAVKRINKTVLADRARRLHGLELDPETLFDCQVKRIHEYKRQLLNALQALALYQRLRDGEEGGVPRTVIFAGKAAPGYAMAKLIIRLIHALAEVVNGDAATRDRLRIVFLPNYSVSLAELIFPACDLSEQISTAGSEASGTGNMKAALNGALTIGTLDGANVEIRDAVGTENMFVFGHTAEGIAELRVAGTPPGPFLDRDPELRAALDFIAADALAPDEPGLFRPIVEELRGRDRYFLCADFRGYVEAQARAAAAYARPPDWWRMSVLNVAGMGNFSSDRTTREYAEQIWQARPVRVPPAD